jgi:hypothetical protein
MEKTNDLLWSGHVASILGWAFPGAVFRYGGKDFNVFEVASENGLLPLLVRQAQINAGFVFGGVRGMSVETSESGITGMRAAIGKATPPCLALPFILDAAFLAGEMTRRKFPGDAETVIRVECLVPPVMPLDQPAIAEIFAAPGMRSAESSEEEEMFQPE